MAARQISCVLAGQAKETQLSWEGGGIHFLPPGEAGTPRANTFRRRAHIVKSFAKLPVILSPITLTKILWPGPRSSRGCSRVARMAIDQHTRGGAGSQSSDFVRCQLEFADGH